MTNHPHDPDDQEPNTTDEPTNDKQAKHHPNTTKQEPNTPPKDDKRQTWRPGC
jgi:hypothetical protein